MTANPLDIVGRSYEQSSQHPYTKESIIIGAAYLIARDYDPPKVIIARKRYNNMLIEHADRRYRAGLVNPPDTRVGDWISMLEAEPCEDNPNSFRRDRRAQVQEVTDDGLIVSQASRGRFKVTYWVFHPDNSTRSRHNLRDPKRRQMVLDRLSDEGMRRIGDTGYAISAKEFFENFDLPRPEVHAWAYVDVERKVAHNEMSYELRSVFDNDNVTSLRSASLKGRAKISLPKAKCRCKEITQEEALQAWGHRAQDRWTVVKLHKVECIWCMNEADAKTAVANGEL